MNLLCSIEEFRKMFSLEKKFKAVADIERFVLEVAQKELDESSPYSFTWERQEVSSRGRNGKKVVGHLADLRERAARSGKGTGWIINGLKGKIK